jgi:hypothetical protein
VSPSSALLFAKRRHSGAAVDTATGEARDLKSYLTPNGQELRLRAMWLAILCLLASGMCPSMTQPQAPAGVPVIKITKEDSSIKFHVKASVAIDGTFDKCKVAETKRGPGKKPFARDAT